MRKKSNQSLLIVELVQFDRSGNEIKRIQRPKMQAEFIVRNQPGWKIIGDKKSRKPEPPVLPKVDDETDLFSEEVDFSKLTNQQKKNLIATAMDGKSLTKAYGDKSKEIRDLAAKRAEELGLKN